MEKDVVCGMQVDPAKAVATSQYGGKTYYFCSKSCKSRFDANPGKYAV
ncbi:MAG TPA: YHS domain-containing protein [Vicinamibacterales bacterium]|nr:YHS domain-containing protein [Vicinamibacterales bacterium]